MPVGWLRPTRQEDPAHQVIEHPGVARIPTIFLFNARSQSHFQTVNGRLCRMTFVADTIVCRLEFYESLTQKKSK
jgi:hypothetical protein